MKGAKQNKTGRRAAVCAAAPFWGAAVLFYGMTPAGIAEEGGKPWKPEWL